MLLSRGLEQMRQEASRRMPLIGANLHRAVDAPLRKSAELISNVSQSGPGISERRCGHSLPVKCGTAMLPLRRVINVLASHGYTLAMAARP